MNEQPTRFPTRLSELLGIQFPIIQAPMAGYTTPELVAAVSNAGGLGMFGGARTPPDELRGVIRRIRELTDRPFGVNLLLAPPEPIEGDGAAALQVLQSLRQEMGLPAASIDLDLPPAILPDQFAVILEEQVPVFGVAMGDPAPFVEDAHRTSTLVTAMVTTVEEAMHAARSGVDFIVAQGADAGGHRSTFLSAPGSVYPMIGTMALVPQVVDAVDVPVIAAGGIADGRGLVAALALGADGVQIGTRFLLSRESAVSRAYRERLIAAVETDATVTKALTGRPASTVRNRLVEAYEQAGADPLPWPYQAVAADDIYGAAMSNDNADYFPVYAGQALRLMKQEHSAADIVADILDEAQEVVGRLRQSGGPAVRVD